jgi:hypothetical protein
MLEDNMNSMMGGYGGQTGGVLGQGFGDVMNSMSQNIDSNAQQGVIPFFNGSDYNIQSAQAKKLGVQTFGGMTAAQISQQMSIGGPLSVLPFMGGVNKLIFPIAGLWSMYDGMRSMNQMRNEASQEVAARFDPSQMNYNQSLQEYYDVTDRWQRLGPFH